MIRQATENDLRHLTRLSEIFHKEHWFGKHTGFDYEYCFDQFKSNIISPLTNVLVADVNNVVVGYCVAFICGMHYTPSVRCTIGYTYIDPNYRTDGLFGDLVQAQTDWAADHDCVDINISDGGQYRGKFGTVLKALGFERTGTDGYKVLAQ